MERLYQLPGVVSTPKVISIQDSIDAAGLDGIADCRYLSLSGRLLYELQIVVSSSQVFVPIRAAKEAIANLKKWTSPQQVKFHSSVPHLVRSILVFLCMFHETDKISLHWRGPDIGIRRAWHPEIIL